MRLVRHNSKNASFNRNTLASDEMENSVTYLIFDGTHCVYARFISILIHVVLFNNVQTKNQPSV